MVFYNLVVEIISTLLLPYFFIRFKGVARNQRFGIIEGKFKNTIWIHAASVGEVNAVKPLLIKLIEKYPDRKIVFTTMTETGQEIATKISPELLVYFIPLDNYFFMNRFINNIQPVLIVLVETEFWPNMLLNAGNKKIPILIVNGRISNKSFPIYKRTKFFWKPLWRNIVAVNSQSEQDAERFSDLGFSNVQNTGNLKFSLDLPNYNKIQIRSELNFSENDFVIVLGSSRPGEEKLLKSILPALQRNIKNLKLIIVPRHLNRIAEIKEIFKEENYLLYSSETFSSDILIVDEMGILSKFYALSDLAIVGGSFFDFGGHNPLEPAFYGVPIIMGEDFSSCRDSVEKLQENKGIIISSKEILLENILNINKSEDFTTKLGANAKKTLKANSGSLDKNLKSINDLLKDRI